MAQVITLVDDIDGSPGADSIGFNLAGQEYALDLGPDNTAELRELLEKITPFLDAAIKAAELTPPAARVPDPAPQGARAPSRPDLPAPAGDIRAWARANGWEVSVKGRVPKAVVEAFVAADNGQKGNQPSDVSPLGTPGMPTVVDPAFTGPAIVPDEIQAEIEQYGGSIPESGLPPTMPDRPADDAPVKQWQEFAHALGHEGAFELNRSQIRTLLGLEQPLPTGAEWGDMPPGVPAPTSIAPSPEAGSTPEPTLGQRLHREADARKAAAQAEREQAAADAQAAKETAESAESALQEAELAEEQVPLTPEQVDELARQEIEAANAAAAPVVEELPIAPVSPILPFKTP